MSEYTPTTEDMQRLVYEQGSLATTQVTWEGFNRWLAQVKAEAWDEGSVHGARKCLFAADLEPCPHNPYREETE